MEATDYFSQGILLEAPVDFRDHSIESAQDPAVEEVLLGGVELTGKVLDEVELRLGELVGLPDLVAELTVADDLLDVEVDAAALHHVGQ